MNVSNIKEKLVENGLKVTPQRLAILDAFNKLQNHPTAEKIIEFIHKNHPNIAIGTVYKVLDTFVENNIIKKVTTEKDVMRYDAIMEKHHHLYCTDSDKIEDYTDNELDVLLNEYFNKHQINGFEIEDIKIQIIGKHKK